MNDPRSPRDGLSSFPGNIQYVVLASLDRLVFHFPVFSVPLLFVHGSDLFQVATEFTTSA